MTSSAVRPSILPVPLSRDDRSTKSLIVVAVVSFTLYLALSILVRAPSLRLLPGVELKGTWLGRLSDAVTPTFLLTASWDTRQAVAHEALYALLVTGLVLLWVRALWLVRPGWCCPTLGWILLATTVFSVPLILLPALFSGDVYLYMFYGRMLSVYHENPILWSPQDFGGDPLLERVLWQWLPASYGPVWLLLSGALTRIAGDSLIAGLIIYKVAALGLHIFATAVVWKILSDDRRELAAWGAVFYGWNPLVLFEVAGNGHNEAALVFLVAASLLALSRRRWLWAIGLLAAAGMVKAMALVLMPVLVLAYMLTATTRRSRIVLLLKSIGTAAVLLLLLYAPLWAGTELLENIRSNPAATDYNNSLWQLLRDNLEVLVPGDVAATMLHVARHLMFLGACVFLLDRLRKGRPVVDVLVMTWFAYCLSLSWVWPWYFLTAIVVAAVKGPGRSAAVAAGLTIGGLLFWIGWPDPPLPAAPWLYHYRSVLLFAPAVALAFWSRASQMAQQALGTEIAWLKVA